MASVGLTISSSMRYCWEIFCLVALVMEMTLHFFTLNCMPQVLLHWTSMFSSCCSMWQSACVLTSRYRRQSSANWQIDEDVSEEMSLMKMRKSRGPSTVNCGMPDITGASLEVNPSTKTTLWFLLDRNDSTHPMMSLLRLYCLSFCNRRWWGTLSKVFAKSSTVTSACECPFGMDYRSWAVMISWDSQGCCCLKPCWMSTRML